MPFYKPTPFRVEIVQVTEENISKVKDWVSLSPVVTTSDFTGNSFVMVYHNNPPENVTVGCSVIKRTNDSFGVLPDTILQTRWQEVSIEEANSLPQINRQLKSFQDVNWVRFSEMVL